MREGKVSGKVFFCWEGLGACSRKCVGHWVNNLLKSQVNKPQHMCGCYSQVAEQGLEHGQLHPEHPWGLARLQPVHSGLQHSHPSISLYTSAKGYECRTSLKTSGFLLELHTSPSKASLPVFW